MGLNAALAMASRSLEVFSTGIQVSGQNIANASTPGYIRESLRLETNSPYRAGSLVLGTGVSAAGIRQNIDQYLEKRIHTSNSDYFAAQARNKIYKQLEVQIGELGTGDISTRMSEFLNALQDVANLPESSSTRQLVIRQGEQLAGEIRALRASIDELRTSQTVSIDSLVKESNLLIDQISTLNSQITRLESSGLLKSDAGGLRTLRYQALSRLSEIVPIQYREREDGGVDVFSNSDFLVLGGSTQHLETFASVNRNVRVQSVRLSTTHTPVGVNGGGELQGVIEGRDEILGGFVDSLDKYASNLIFEFNKIYSSGSGLQGFTELTSTGKVFDATFPLNSSAAELPFSVTHGSFQVTVKNRLTGLSQTSTIQIDLDGIDPANDTSLNGLAAQLAAVGNLSASVNANGRLTLTADANFEFSFSNDTSGALAALGINTFFVGSSSTDIGVNSLILSDHRYLATSQGGGPGDNSNALLLAQFHTQGSQGLGGETLDSFYDSLIATIAQASASESIMTEGLADFRQSLQSQREQFSGVSLDEEAIRILEFQRAYQASARLVSTIDELFRTLLEM